MLQGTHLHRLDEKGRLKLPTELVGALGATFTVTRGVNGCLWLFPEDEWKRVSANLLGRELVAQEKLHLRRYFVGGAVSLTPDNQQRVTIPPVLRTFADLEHEVVLVGLGDRAELWSAEAWRKYEDAIEPDTLEEWARQAGV